MRAKWLPVCALILACQAVPVVAQGGYVLFGGEKSSELNLSYTMINNRSRARLNMLDLMIAPKNVAIAELRFDYPYFFDNSFDLNSVQVLDDNTRQAFEIDRIERDDESRVLVFILKKPIPSNIPLRVRWQNFTNPRTAGTFKIQVRFLGTEPNPIFRYAGSWLISFN